MTVAQIVAEPFAICDAAEPRALRLSQFALAFGSLGQSVDAGRYPHEFSGGSAMGIGIARALALKPKLIVSTSQYRR